MSRRRLTPEQLMGRLGEACCDDMKSASTLDCSVHDRIYDCPDVLVYYSEAFDEYGLAVPDGGTSYVLISFCPFCGTRLPESKRGEWFDTLAKLGFDDPWDQDIPEELLSAAWYR